MRVALQCQDSPADALAPLYELAGRFEFDLVPRSGADSRTVQGHAAKTMQEIGEMVAAAMKAIEDGRVTCKEADAFNVEYHQAIAALHGLHNALNGRVRGVN